MRFPLLLLEFKFSTGLAPRSHFSVEIDKCKPKFYANSLFSRTSRMWDSLQVSCFPVTYLFQNLNAASILIFCHIESWSFNALSLLKISQFVHH